MAYLAMGIRGAESSVRGGRLLRTPAYTTTMNFVP